MEDSQVNLNGDQGGQDGNLGWRAALPDEFKEHEYVKTFQKPGDFVKSALEIKTEHESLKTKMEGALFKPGENATQEEREAFYRGIGKPEKATEYDFPTVEGAENDPRMVEWAQKTFHAANLNKDQAAQIGKSWNEFMAAMVKADTEAKEKAKAEAETKIKTELGEQYDEAFELSRRLLSENATPEELAFLDESGAGNSPVIAKLIFKLAKLTGEDKSLQRGGNPKDQTRVGMNYTTMEGFKGY